MTTEKQLQKIIKELDKISDNESKGFITEYTPRGYNTIKLIQAGRWGLAHHDNTFKPEFEKLIKKNNLLVDWLDSETLLISKE